MTDEEWEAELDKRTGPSGILYECSWWCKEFPPYPENWIILSSDECSEVFEGEYGTYGRTAHTHHKSVKYAVIYDDDEVVIGHACCWLTDDFEVEWSVDPEYGARLTKEEFSHIARRLSNG